MSPPDCFRRVLAVEYVETGLPFLMAWQGSDPVQRDQKIAALRAAHARAEHAPCLLLDSPYDIGLDQDALGAALERGEVLFHPGDAMRRARAPGAVALDWIMRLDGFDECVLLPEVAPFVFAYLGPGSSHLGIDDAQHDKIVTLAEALWDCKSLRAFAARSVAVNMPLLFLRVPEEDRRRGDEDGFDVEEVGHWLLRPQPTLPAHVVALGHR